MRRSTMRRPTFVLAFASALSLAPALGAQQQPPAGPPPAGQPDRPRGPGRRGMMPGQPGQPGEPGMRGRMGSGMMGPGMMGPGGGERMGGPSPAEMLLAHTGELKLSDAQVTRLAAIARRTAERRTAMRTTMQARMDSVRKTMQANPPGANGERPRFAPSSAIQAEMQKLRDQARADLRDALTVLTPDQQAQAWELRARNAGRMRRMAPMARMPRAPRR